MMTNKAGKSESAHQIKRILFVCTENSNRSQMAEAFARMHGGHTVEAWSAGSKPSGHINPRAITAMNERGISLTTHHSKGLHDIPQIQWDVLVTMGCGDACPTARACRREDWQLPDPREMQPAEFALIRDEIEQRVLNLLKTLNEESLK